MQLTNNELMIILGFVATLIAIITPVIKLNTTITRLNATLESFQKQTTENHEELKGRVDRHGLELDEIRENQVEMKKEIEHINKHMDKLERGTNNGSI